MFLRMVGIKDIYIHIWLVFEQTNNVTNGIIIVTGFGKTRQLRTKIII